MSLASTARQIIEDALEAEGFLGEGLTASPQEMTRGLRALNVMLHAWQAKQLTVPFYTEESFTLTIGQSVYTIGAAADFATVRPIDIAVMYIRDSGNNDYPLREVELRKWSRGVAKGTDGRPTEWYYEPEEPLGKIRFDYEPSLAETLYIFSLKPFTTFSTLDTTDSFPDEWIEPIKYNLAIRIAGAKGKTPYNVTAALAADTLRDIKALTSRQRTPVLVVDRALRTGGLLSRHSGYNINVD